MNPFIEQTEYSGKTFKNLSLPGAKIAGRVFDGCTFKGCDFRDVVFAGCRFSDCALTACEMNGIRLPECSLSEVRFEDCRLVGVNWTETTWARGRFLLPARFDGCALNHSLFIGLDMHEITISGGSAREADFSEANLSKAVCPLTDFQGARFWHTDLTDADLRGAINYTIPANLNTLKRTKFSLPEALSLLYSLDIIIADAGDSIDTIG